MKARIATDICKHQDSEILKEMSSKSQQVKTSLFITWCLTSLLNVLCYLVP